MIFKVNCELEYIISSPATFIFALKCIETNDQTIITESLTADNADSIENFHIMTGMNRFSRIKASQVETLNVFYSAEMESAYSLFDVSTLPYEPGSEVLAEAIPFLFPSRYCQSDIIRREANDLFGNIQGSYAIAAAISDWVYENISYVSGSSGETSSAVDTLETRNGVCRDFAHLAIAFCRAMSIPARYATVYAYQLVPQDFHAVFEVYIGGWWYVFDPTRLAPLNGLVRIASGRDAADTAVCTIFGNTQLTKSIVSCDFIGNDFQPVTREYLINTGQSIAIL